MHGPPGLKGHHGKTKTLRKYGRSKRAIRWPLMPDGLTVEQVRKWMQAHYEDTTYRSR